MSVAVLGGGPAAATAALRLAQRGVPVTVYRPAHLAEKPCGGAVPGWFRQHLAQDGVGADCVRPSMIAVENAAGTCLEVAADGLEIYRRSDLDPALVGRAVAAGATLVEAKVEAFASADGGVTVRSAAGERRHSWVIGGDGARGLSRRTVGIRHDQESVGLGASIPGEGDGPLTLFFPDVADAYAWIFPRPGGISVGVAYDGERLSDGAAGVILERFLDRHLGGGARRLQDGRQYRYPIPLFSQSSIAAVRAGLRRRIVLVGDAAGVADPLTREGIRHAALSGEWAADCVASEAIETYPDRLASGLGAEMERAHRAAGLFFDDRFAQWMVPVCRSHPRIRAVLGDLLSCVQGYSGLRGRLLRAAVCFDRDGPSEHRPGDG